jgi:hypothetical protein
MVITGLNRLEKTRTKENFLYTTCEKEGQEKFRTYRIAKLGLARNCLVPVSNGSD